MRIFLLMACIVYFSSFSMQAQNKQTPIIDRELFFDNPEIAGGQLSPDGKWISFMKAYNGIMNVWIKAFDEPFDKARPITNSQRPLYGYFWTYDSKYVLFAKDNDGDENINIYAVSPLENVVNNSIPHARNLTSGKEVTARIYTVSRKNPNILMIGLNDRDKAWHDLYQLEIESGKLTKLYENTERITSYIFDWDETLRILSKTDEKGTTVFYNIGKDKKLKEIYSTNVDEGASIIGWTPDNKQLYLETNKGNINLSTVFLMDPETKKMIKYESDPRGRVDFGALFIDNNTRKIVSTSYTDDKIAIYWKDKTWEGYYKFLQSKFPGREISFQSSTKDYKKILVVVDGDKYVAEIYLFYPETQKLIFQYTPRPKLKKLEQYLSPMQAIRYLSSDGLEIPAYLTIPMEKEAKDLPVVVYVHGGPKGARDYWGYDATAQFLANRGYAVLQPNFRASGGYGKKFLNAGDLQWGKLMQDDITWGVKHLIAQGIADPKKIAIMGASYGGYATLAGLAFTPELYTCGIDIVGPSNLNTLMASVPAYWESGRAFLYAMVGDPATTEGKKRLDEASPLFSAEKIVKPLLIVQGANDPRVKKAESDQIVIALRDKGKKVQYLLADDEGHGFAKPVNAMAMYVQVEKFLSETIGGRLQASATPEVSKRLKELFVDITKLSYEPPVSSFPPINNIFKEGTTAYDMLIETQGQKIPIKFSRTITKKGQQYEVSEKSSTPMGDMGDVMLYNTNFTPVEETISQSGNQITLSFSKEEIQGKAMGNNMKIEADGAYFVDGAGVDLFIGGLPLVSGGKLTCFLFDLTTLTLKKVNIEIKGSEKVNNVDCTKIEVTSVDNNNSKSTFWIDPKLKIAQKKQTVIPAMGGGGDHTTITTTIIATAKE